MRKTLASILLVTLILVSSLNMAFIVKPTSAQNDQNEIAEKGFPRKIIQPTVPDQEKSLQGNRHDVFEGNPDTKQNETSENSRQRSPNMEDQWNLNYTNEWSDFAYVDGNKTRLVIGVDGGNPEGFTGLEKIAAEHGAKIVNTVSIGGEVRAVIVELAFASVATFSEKARLLNLATYIEPNMKFKATITPNDPYWMMQWGPQKIEADWSWNTTVGSRDILVAVIDTGIYYYHEDLATNYVALGYDWVNNDTDPLDDHGHGTHCAGIIAAVLNNSIGIAGLAQIRVMAEKGLNYMGWGTEDWLTNAIIHATDAGANIISMSWGGYFDSKLIYEAIKYAYDAGVLLVAAAGNEATSTKPYPAGYKEVIAVAATDQNDYTAPWSNFGDWIELAAPGVSIYSTVPWGYESWSGTSMACPHVAGVAALAGSLFPNKTRDWVRLWLRYTADDLGDKGFDIHYGYGRVNARKSVEWVPPQHELIAYEWETPPYLEPEASATINATILNFAENDETDVIGQLYVNGTIVDFESIALLTSGNSTTISLSWNPMVEGLYNVTLYVVPVLGEANVENNVLSKYVFVGFPVKAVVLHSAGNVFGDIISNWQVLNNEWYSFGNTMVSIDYTTLNKEDITYEDIAATEANVLIISCAYDPYAGWEFTDSEIEAIERYVHEGHGFIGTAGTFYYGVPNNNKLADLFGLNKSVMWYATWTNLLHIINITHPLFRNVPNPFIFEEVETVISSDGRWDQNELARGEYLALGHYRESAIVACRGSVYISPWLEIIPAYYHHHLQLLYNAITWSRYQKPEHELIASLEVPKRLNPGESAQLNATGTNRGLNNETEVTLELLINGTIVDSFTIPELPVDSSYTLNYDWTPTTEGVYNITAYAPPMHGEEFTENNIVQKMALVLLIYVRRVLVYTDDYAVSPSSRYPIVALKNLGINYTHYSDDPNGFGTALVSQPWDLVLVDHANLYALGNYWTELDEYVCNGGLLVLSTFDIDGSDSEPTTLWSTLGVRWVSDMYSPQPVFRWIPEHPMFTFPNAVGNLTSYIEGYLDDGDHVAATTGTAIASFTKSPKEEIPAIIVPPTEEHAAIVVGNKHQTVLFSFLLCEFRYDQDSDEKLDAVELWENAIVHVTRRHEHDLAVSLDAPKSLKPGKSALLNATVQNLGLNNEFNLILQLFVNDTMVENVTIPELLTEASYTVSHHWTSTIEGTYNITAYAPPILGEDKIGNNLRSAKIFVSSLVIALCKNVDPWDYPSNERALDLYGIPYVVLRSSDFGDVDLSVYTKVVIASDQDQIFYDAMDNYRWWFEDYVRKGGVLEIHAADWGWHGGHWVGLLPGDLAWASYYGQYVTVVDPSHPVLWTPNIITEAELDMWNFAVHGYFSSYPANSRIVIIEDFTRKPAYLEFEYSAGIIVASSQTLEWVYKRRFSLILENSLLYVPVKYAHDLVVMLDSPVFLELYASTLLEATVRNRGLRNETCVELYLLINGTGVDNATIPELLVGQSYTFSHVWTPARIGNYNITAYAQPVPGEEYITNNIVAQSTYVFFYTRQYVSHQWIGGGIPMGWHADDASWNYTLPFEFPFYEMYDKTIYISSNGLITFIRPDTSHSNNIPYLSTKFAIAPAWDDWVTYDPFDIYIWQNSTHVGIRWYVAACYNNSIVANFEAVLRSDGLIQFNYGYNNETVSATIGISNGVNHILAEDARTLDYVNTIVFDVRVHDVAIHNIAISETQVYVGEIVNINVTAANEGTATENFNVTLYHDPSGNSSGPTEPHPGNAMWIEPSTTYLAGLPQHYRFNVTVWINFTSIDPGDHIGAWQFVIVYEKAYINATRAGYTAGTMSEWFKSAGTWKRWPSFDHGSFNATHDYIIQDEVWASPDVGEPPNPKPQEGSYGSLVWIEFELTNVPTEPFTGYFQFITTGIRRCKILNENGEDVTYQFDFIANAYSFAAPPLPPYEFIGVQEVVNLLPNSSTILTFTWNTTGLPLGAYVMTAIASSVKGEVDVRDNIYTDGIVEILWIHDVSVANVSVSRTWIYEGQDVHINVTVGNSGCFKENVTLSVFYNITAGEEVGTQEIENLLPNESRTMTLTWDTTGVTPCKNYTITALAIIRELDSNPADNMMESPEKVKVRILGDMNDDSMVDIEDIYIVAMAFGAYPSHPQWNPYLDINSDDIIDIVDIYIVAINYGRCL